MTGNTTCDPRVASIYTVLRATRRTSPVPSGAPVFGFGHQKDFFANH
jgi:hypothetical protein